MARNTVNHDLQSWLRDPAFAGVRGPEALAWLPAAEREAWQELWSDVTDTLDRAWGRTGPGQQGRSKMPLPAREVYGEAGGAIPPARAPSR
jgi:hypothetical protein